MVGIVVSNGERDIRVNINGALDLLWSDPENHVEAWAISPRGGGYLFGSLPTTAVSYNRNLLQIEAYFIL